MVTYIIPLRREFLKVPEYRRAGRAAKAVKKFIMRHMKIRDKDSNKVKLDRYLNSEIWFRGRTNPPSKIKVTAEKDEKGNVKVELAELPEKVKFLKMKHEKRAKMAEKKTPEKKISDNEEKKDEKTEEEKKDEQEKEKAVAEKNIQRAEMESKAQKHTTPVKETKTPRKSMNMGH